MSTILIGLEVEEVYREYFVRDFLCWFFQLVGFVFGRQFGTL